MVYFTLHRNHLALSDKVIERRKIMGSLEQSQKRKRASREDILYDQPLLKQKKKKFHHQ